MVFGSNILEIAIGMLLIYTILSLICSSATELVANRLMALRSKNLEAGIRSLLTAATSGDEQRIADELYKHPLIMALVRKPPSGSGPAALTTAQAQATEQKQGWLTWFGTAIRKAIYNVDNQKPSYIPARTFSMALLNILEKENPVRTVEGAASQTFDTLRQVVAGLPNDRFNGLKRQLLPVIDAAAADVVDEAAKLRQARQNIDKWFDNAMEQTTAWYKQRVQGVTFVIAFAICLAVNGDTLMIVNALANDPALRSALVAESEQFIEQPPPQLQAQVNAALGVGVEATPETGGAADATPEPGTEPTGDTDTPAPAVTPPPNEIQELQQKLEALGVFGWSGDPNDRRSFPNPLTDFGDFALKIIGLLISTFAVSLGAPFWFGLLNKLVNLRTANQPPPPASSGATVTASAKATIPGTEEK